MNRTKKKVFSVLSVSIMFYELVVFSPFIVKAVFAILGYTAENMPILLIASMLCSLLLGSVTVIRKEHIVTAISIITCAAGTLWALIISRNGASFASIFWLTSGYLLLLILVLLSILGKKTGKQKLFLILQKVIVALLFVNIAANIFIATKQWYVFFGIIWGNIYLEAAMVPNSLACAFWGMWYITHSKYSEK